MLKRKAMARLLRWRQSKTHQAILITGARQVGKTYLTREFARANYPVFIEFNLLEDTAARDSFAAATNVDDLLLRMSVAAPAQMEPGKTLVFFDEIQECPEIVTYIKFLVEKSEYDYVLSGSLLGVELENIRSYPVGYLSELLMFPLDYEEFCWANGLGTEQLQLAWDAFATRRAVPDFLHERLMNLFHKYLVIGGMPDAVRAFLRDNSVDQVRVAQDDIVAFYKKDISKYAPKDRRLVIRNIYELIPSELSRQNRRFKLSSITDVKRFTQVQDEFLWLTQANVALATYNVSALAAPLLLNESRSSFKLFYSDVGLLTSRYPKQASLGLLDGRPTAQMGRTYENFAAQELAAHGYALRYYANKRIGELDFVIEGKDSRIAVLEVKSGRTYKTHAALSNALAAPNHNITSAYVFAETNVEQRGEVLYLPIYLLAALKTE
jgi:predicted AAA+ superfamily ATPase